METLFSEQEHTDNFSGKESAEEMTYQIQTYTIHIQCYYPGHGVFGMSYT